MTSAQNGVPCSQKLVVSPSAGTATMDLFGSSTIENKADWCVNNDLQSDQFIGRRIEEEETEEIVV